MEVVNVSLPDDDVEHIDQSAQPQGSPSFEETVRSSLTTELGAAYEDAWDDWAASPEGEPSDGELWDATTADGSN
jgi:hypothetical protein